jgi:hypothetical protein
MFSKMKTNLPIIEVCETSNRVARMREAISQKKIALKELMREAEDSTSVGILLREKIENDTVEIICCEQFLQEEIDRQSKKNQYFLCYN